VSGRSVAKSSSAFRIPNTEVKDPHCWSMRYKSQCGERLPFATKYLFGVGGSAILSTGDYRAFRSRTDDTWGASPWQSRIHTAGVCVISRSVAIGSPAYRITR
ncbi:MAG: hypothetical protein P4L69_15740, partial [Desulfosporosinus sp.]|nr:hypothetical protein [Desulfosporosinus sp.]